MENASKASIHLRNLRYLRENFLEFITLQGIYGYAVCNCFVNRELKEATFNVNQLEKLG